MIEKKPSKLAKLVLKISEGVFNKVVDLVLFWVYYSAEMSPFSGGSLYQRFSRIERDLSRFDSQTLKHALKYACQKGWINKKLEITSRGQKRLESILPKYEKKQKWNGNWYIVAYDIPENKRWLRDILRDNLVELGFGQLHKSLFICPYNFLGDVEKIVNEYHLSSYVLLAISNKLGREPSRDLAERVWKLNKINEDYEKYLQELKSRKLSPKEAIFRYLIILKRDPQLPKELLPDNWKGDEAHKIYRKMVWKNRLGKLKFRFG